MKEDIELYIELYKQSKELALKQKELKEKLKACDVRIIEYMKENELNGISVSGVTIKKYDRKMSQKFKKEVMTNKIVETVGDLQKAKEIAESVCNNDNCVITEALKVTLK